MLPNSGKNTVTRDEHGEHRWLKMLLKMQKHCTITEKDAQLWFWTSVSGTRLGMGSVPANYDQQEEEESMNNNRHEEEGNINPDFADYFSEYVEYVYEFNPRELNMDYVMQTFRTRPTEPDLSLFNYFLHNNAPHPQEFVPIPSRLESMTPSERFLTESKLRVLRQNLDPEQVNFFHSFSFRFMLFLLPQRIS